MAAATTERLSVLLGPTVERLGLDLETVELSSAGRRRVLRVVVDKDGGVGLDEMADVTRAVSVALDSHGLLGEQPYTLEVTSRGVDRPLTLPRHWQRNVGRLVDVQTSDGSELTGRINSADETAAALDTEGNVVQVDYADVRRARVQVEFTRRS